jgi:hypothetical protein
MQGQNFAAVATEHELSEVVCERLLRDFAPELEVTHRLRRGGFGYLKNKLRNFLELSKMQTVFLLTDLDQSACAPSLIRSWMGDRTIPGDFLFRVAEREIEAWLLGDENGIRKLLGIKSAKIPEKVDSIPDPKKLLLKLAASAPRSLRQELCGAPDAAAAQGLGYNKILCDFVRSSWHVGRARERSESMERTIRRLEAL